MEHYPSITQTNDTQLLISQRQSKKQHFEMEKYLFQMQNRIKMLEIYKQKEQSKQATFDLKNDQLQQIRVEYQHFMQQLANQKEYRKQALIEFRDKNQQLKREQNNYKIQRRESLLNQKRIQSEIRKNEQIHNDSYIKWQKDRSKSFNQEKKNKVISLEIQAHQNIVSFRENKQNRYKQQHQMAIVNSFREKSEAFVKIQSLLDKEQEIIDSLNSHQKSKITTISQNGESSICSKFSKINKQEFNF